MEASIRGHGARHRTGSLSLSLAPLPLPTRLSGVFPPFCSSCTALLSLGGLLIGIETPPKPPRLLLARLIHFLPPCAHPLFAFSHPHPTVYSQRSCALFRFLPPRLLRVMYIIDENCPRKDAISHRIETERDCHGLSRIEIFERFFPSIEFHETRTITFVTKFLKLESNHRELERKLQRIAKKFLFFSTTIITNYYNK